MLSGWIGSWIPVGRGRCRFALHGVRAEQRSGAGILVVAGPLDVTIFLPAYKSEKTIVRCLRTITAQHYPLLEVMVVDSSPDDRVEELIRSGFPKVAYLHSKVRLLPHAARNLGA